MDGIRVLSSSGVRHPSTVLVDGCCRIGEHVGKGGEVVTHPLRTGFRPTTKTSRPTNRNRPHRGRGIDGRTPYQVFKTGIRKPRSPKTSTTKEVKTAA